LKVAINKGNLTLILEAITESEKDWRISAGKQFSKDAHDTCIEKAARLHDIYVSLSNQLDASTKPRIQKIDPFDEPRGSLKSWDPNDPRNW
jgi:hypothetical protein